MLPPSSAATQSDVEGQEITPTAAVPSTLVTVQADGPPVGFLEVSTSPRLSPATQRDVEGHEIASMNPLTSTLAPFHVGVAAPGSVDVRTLPLKSPATQSEPETQFTADGALGRVWSPKSNAAGCDHRRGDAPGAPAAVDADESTASASKTRTTAAAGVRHRPAPFFLAAPPATHRS